MRTIKVSLFLLLATTFTFFSCKKKKLDPNEIRSDYYFQATIGGEQITYQEGESDYLNIIGDFGEGRSAAGMSQYVPFTCIAHEDGLFSTDGLKNSGAVALIKASSSLLLPQQIGQQIVTGDIGFGTRSYESSDEAIEGGFLSWVDGNGTEWTSNGDQSGSSFKVVEYIDADDVDASTHKIIMVEFSGTLYNGAGGSQTVTAGKARGRLIVY